MSIFTSAAAPAISARLLSQDCALCGVRSREVLCAACHRDLPFRDALGCPRCNAPGVNEQPCGTCLADPPHFDATTSAFHYAYPLDRLVQAYKFNAYLSLLPLFADALGRAIRCFDGAGPRPDLVIPLPLAPRRLAERGFNQSSLLGERLSKMLGIRFAARGMSRIRETAPQTGLSRDARFKNVRAAFECARRLDGMRVALVDDVMTTGATLSAAAKAIKQAGAAQVCVWVIARADKQQVSAAAGPETVRFDDVED